ncbi:hypothetical protein MSAS_23980 [Mycobacterium saskatchewanense]|uniref:VWFA domain-containing protein n=1 Tax=Mycobacterium saskatchewanense TaxID=220927 RepID=A0AAJ3TUB1_9MYCO|nr:VWA domain-containing protein [Mycobacterium saskatchewanense]ORW70364.1 hypothetical protein AWC23_17070 [Mycobacterium saskatchewanense]BBX63224.1 hypothetical protein MSAS_23980 [Mycobacterium saskatchewanense]
MNTALREALSPVPAAVNASRLLDPRSLGPGDHRAEPKAAASPDPVEVAINLAPPGSCSAGGTTTFVVLDESAGVTGSGGNDPLSRRHAEAALAIRHVAAACRCRRDRVALVPFDRGSAGFVAPQPLTRNGLRTITRGLQRLSHGMGLSSELGPPLDYVETQASQQRGDVALVVFSDLLLTDQNPSTVLTRLRAFPGYVHAVVLGAIPPSVLVDDPYVAVTRLTPSTPPGEAAHAVFDGLNHYRSPSSTTGSAAHPTESPHRKELSA